MTVVVLALCLCCALTCVNGYRHIPVRRLSRCHTVRFNLNLNDIDGEEVKNITPASTTTNSGGIKSFLLLNSVAVLWGTQHPIIKSSLSLFDSTSFLNFWRFLLSSALFSPAFFQAVGEYISIRNGSNSNTASMGKMDGLFKAGIELGLYTFLGFSFQAIGLETTTASKSAFLLYLNVKIVPFLSFVITKKQISPSVWSSAFLALSGTALLSTDGSNPLNVGDLWCIAAAFASAAFILRLESFSNKYDAKQLNAISFVTVALLCGLWTIYDTVASSSSSSSLSSYDYPNYFDALHHSFNLLVSNPWPVVYLGVVTTGLCNYIQTIGQRSVSAEKAAIIYSTDPLYGAFFSWLLLHEKIGVPGLCGGILILLGVWISNKELIDKSITASTDTYTTTIID